MKYFLTLLSIIFCFHSPVFAADRGWERQAAPDSISEILSDPDVNPIKNTDITDLSSIINLLLPYILTLAGLILLVMLIMGGFGMLTAATDAKKAEAAKSRITAALIGFFIIFASYWIIQILEIILGVSILK